MRIRRLGVVGAGTMGSGIAALAASAGIPVVLLDIPGTGTGTGADRDAPARGGLERAKKARPAAFMDVDRASAIQIGNTEDDLEQLASCDLVVEAIIEQLEPKRALYERLERILPSHAIVASNTSGIPMHLLTEGRGAGFRQRFLGMHFFNPPRYLHLLEIIPAPETSKETIDAARRFSDRILGKGIVVAKDVPGFVANRLGVFGMVLAIRMMEKHDLTIDEADVLTGVLTGRSKSATYRTADLSGIDVIAHVTRGLSETTGEDFSLSPWVLDLVQAGRVGEKSGAGFYKRVGKEIHTLDWKTGEYAPQRKLENADVARLTKLPLAERFAAFRDWTGREAAFVKEYILRFSHYVLATTPTIAYDIPAVDHAMAWGYAWDAGPFEQMDLLGADWLRRGFAELGLDEPGLLPPKGETFYSPDGTSVRALDGTYEPIPREEDEIRLATFHLPEFTQHVLDDSRDASLLLVGRGVAVLEFHSKMNTLGEGVITALHRALDRVERDGLAGLVIGNEDPRTFTAGADLSMILKLLGDGDWKRLDDAVRQFQHTSLRIREAPFPVVAAPFGLTLGGGCEFSLHADRVQAHAELYMGLVEVGVGLIPAGGGTTELLFRFSTALGPYAEADPFEAVRRAFQLIAMATTSTSALEARKLGFLRDADRITMNRDRLIADAVARVIDLAPDYVPPLPRTITAIGNEALGNLRYAAWAMREAGQITEHEVRIAHELAYVLSGGDGPPRQVTERDIFDLEREAFLRLLGTKETQERMQYMLKTGKPLRN
ncbi:MAG TPA: 3-hydroxyacyl-CoA dehydrogenase/enoyl-CoA hydratase family protein [Gemmatimonadaceae bacterium]|nr:3-hydroxyacyl-CoA dehydrogenase/enoyl-CoA hydratase family protein [Gemmatimonadaceae bacterium]